MREGAHFQAYRLLEAELLRRQGIARRRLLRANTNLAIHSLTGELEAYGWILEELIRADRLVREELIREQDKLNDDGPARTRSEIFKR